MIADAQRLMEEAKVEGCEFAEVDFMKEGYFEGRKEAGDSHRDRPRWAKVVALPHGGRPIAWLGLQ